MSTKFGVFYSIFKKMSDKYYGGTVWEIIGTAMTINLLDGIGLLGFLAKPRTIDEIKGFLKDKLPFEHFVSLLDILSMRGYIRKTSRGEFCINSNAIEKLTYTLSKHPFTEFKPLLKASETIFTEYVKSLSEGKPVHLTDPRLRLIFYDLLGSEFIDKQRETLILYSGGHQVFINKHIIDLFPGFGFNTKKLIETIGYKNVKKITACMTSNETLELAKRVRVKIDGETVLLGDLEKVEIIIIGEDYSGLKELQSNTFETAVSFMGPPSTIDIEYFFSEVRRILQPNGLLVGASLFKKKKKEKSILDFIGKLLGTHRVFGEDEFKELLRKLGYKNIDVFFSFLYKAQKR